MHENKKNINDLLKSDSFKQYVAGDDDNDPFWKDWVNSNAENQLLAEQAKNIILGLQFSFKLEELSEQKVNAELKRTLDKIEIGEQGKILNLDSVSKNKRAFTWMKAVAAALIVPIVAILSYYFMINPTISHHSDFGEQMVIILPDDTKVSLNGNSELTYRKNNPRNVYLKGEAFFNVEKKPETGENFLVVTDEVVVEVLGTAFNVNEREDQTEVALEEGGVKLRVTDHDSQDILMEPGDVVTYSSRTKEVFTKKVAEVQPLVSWKDGVLEFEDAPLELVMKRIEEIYGYTTSYESEELKSRKVFFPLPSNDLEKAIRILEKTLGMEAELLREDRKISLR
ncbi:FecR family protein [Portibacter marinus]|uniref:FecR family protein n=1 Tax=Portibacter marinus TaxID=2898660 RepID=UPI001F3897CB|nr:FecR domain-containing protein [Portibacter marinus]